MKRMIELMDKPLPFSIDKVSDSIFQTSFIIPNTNYTYRIYIEYISEGTENYNYDRIWVIDFSMQVGKEFYTWDISNTGNEIEVFATIAAIFKEFIEKTEPYQFMFSAKEKSRIKLYHIFSRKIEKDFNYTYITDGNYSDGTAFIFEKESL